jgi:hypothetical protein
MDEEPFVATVDAVNGRQTNGIKAQLNRMIGHANRHGLIGPRLMS